MKKYINPFLNITTIALLFVTIYSLHNDVKQIPQLQHQVDSLRVVADSLYGETFHLSTVIGRYEVTNEEVLTKYPKVYEEYNKYLSKETE